MICWVILAVWVPMGSAELRRLSVALSHSPSGSRASWNWRAKTCSSSNCLCLRDGRGEGVGGRWRAEGGGELLLVFYWFQEQIFFFFCATLNWFWVTQLLSFIELLLNFHTFLIIYYSILKNFIKTNGIIVVCLRKKEGSFAFLFVFVSKNGSLSQCVCVSRLPVLSVMNCREITDVSYIRPLQHADMNVWETLTYYDFTCTSWVINSSLSVQQACAHCTHHEQKRHWKHL